MSESGLEGLNDAHFKNADDWQHWKYPETVGNDTDVDDINFNSHQSSEYAKLRMNAISGTTHEPFVMFEFMTIDETKAKAKITAGSTQIKDVFTSITNLVSTAKEDSKEAVAGAVATGTEVMNDRGMDKDDLNKIKESVRKFITDSSTPAERNYTGSISMYMPTDIQINDTMMYNEDSRKLGAALNAIAADGLEKSEIVNWTTITDPVVLAAGGAALSAFGAPAALTAVIGGSIGSLVQTEVQRHTGKIMNPNELIQYQSTGLRSFTFSWTILPDNEDESKQAAGLIKFFRKSAHAKRTSSTLVTVPDHVICSFHGAGAKETEMIQLPACFIETVNVTYNPNNSSFFRKNNAPVEIGLGVTLKEIVPIYKDDVERGY